MSDENTGHISVLLPGARVALFTRDGETRAAFESLAQDWRFARVVLEVAEGDVETAIQTYGGAVSPDLVIVQTETIDEGFSQRLEALAGSCAEGTEAVVIGPVNDVNLYRRLIAMGVRDYLVRPVRADQLANDIAASLINRLGATGSRLIALVGAKGGVGVTALAEGLAWGVSDQLGQKTFFLDAAGGWSTLSVGMDFEPSTTLAEAVRAAVEQNEDSLTRMLFSASDKLTVLSSGGDVMLEDIVAPEGFETLLDKMMGTYPVVIVDLSASPAALRRTALARAHQIVLVTVPTLPSVRAARTLIHEIKQLRGNSDKDVEIVVNMVGVAPKVEVTKAQIEEGLDRKVSLFIDYNPALFIKVESDARKLPDEKDGRAVVDKILTVARKVVSSNGSTSLSGDNDDDADKKGGLGQMLTRLKAK